MPSQKRSKGHTTCIRQNQHSHSQNTEVTLQLSSTSHCMASVFLYCVVNPEFPGKKLQHSKKLYIQLLHVLCFKDEDLFMLPQLANFLAFLLVDNLSVSHIVTNTMKTEIRKLIRSLIYFKLLFC